MGKELPCCLPLVLAELGHSELLKLKNSEEMFEVDVTIEEVRLLLPHDLALGGSSGGVNKEPAGAHVEDTFGMALAAVYHETAAHVLTCWINNGCSEAEVERITR